MGNPFQAIPQHAKAGDPMLHKESTLPRDQKCGCYVGGIVNWRTAVVHYVAKAVGLHVKVEGFPLGTSRNLDRNSVDASSFGSAGLSSANYRR